MFRMTALFSVAFILCACATQQSEPAAVAATPARVEAGVQMQPASFRAPQTATARPTGLAPCARGTFPAQESCWRRGDQHVLFPQSPPAGIDFNADEAAPLASR